MASASPQAATRCDLSVARRDAAVAEWEDERRSEAWLPSRPEDPRWDTMQYLIQVFLEGCDDDLLESPDFDDS